MAHALSLFSAVVSVETRYELVPDVGMPLRVLLTIHLSRRMSDDEIAYLRMVLRRYAEVNDTALQGLQAARGGRAWISYMHLKHLTTGVPVRDPLREEVQEARWGLRR